MYNFVFLTIMEWDLTHIFSSNSGRFQWSPNFEQQIKKFHVYADHVKFYYFFLITLLINIKSYAILLFSGNLSKICCIKLDLLQNS